MTIRSLREMIDFADQMFVEFGSKALIIAKAQAEASTEESVAAVWNIVHQHLELRING